MTPYNELQDLVDTPSENLEVEYKQWLDLKESVVRAKLAQHIAALANHGGGYLVFGFRNDMTVDPSRPADLSDYNQDQFSGIAKKYLTPAVHVEFVWIKSTSTGLEYPVVRVPSHGAVPVCASSSGPSDANGKTQGIVQGTYYVRAIGPASEPIKGPELWQPLIRRCVMAERELLLRNLTQVLAGQQPAPQRAGFSLSDWHARSANQFLTYIVRNTSGTAWPVPINVANYQFSYRILQDDESEIPVSSFISILQQVNNEVKNVVWTGWSMFYPFSREDIKPHLIVEEFDGRDVEIYETNLLMKDERNAGLPDFWKLTMHGWGTLIRIYREDLTEKKGINSYLAPRLLAQEITELLLHAAAMAKNFPAAHSIEFLCEWRGLNNRVIADFDPGIDWHHRVSKQDSRKTNGIFSIPEINGSLPAVASKLISPVLRLFDSTEASPEWIEMLLPTFRKL